MAIDEVVVVEIEVGHDSKIHPKPTANGQTHNWKLFIRGRNSKDISSFVESIEFELHVRNSDFSFQKDYRMIRLEEHPFEIKEKVFVGPVPIKINFRNGIHAAFPYDINISQGSQRDLRHTYAADWSMNQNGVLTSS